MDLETVNVDASPMVFVTRTTPMSQAAIGAAMGETFGTLGAFVGRNRIAVAGPPLTVYRDYGDNSITMDIGFPVLKRPAQLAVAGDVKAGTTPSGTALKAIHVGPYDRLKDTYDKVYAEVERRTGSRLAKSWEVYLGDPITTAPDDLRTEIYVPVG